MAEQDRQQSLASQQKRADLLFKLLDSKAVRSEQDGRYSLHGADDDGSYIVPIENQIDRNGDQENPQN